MNKDEKKAASQEEQKSRIRKRYKGIDRDELEFIPARQQPSLFEDDTTKRVCAYCRVSTGDAKQTSSYELQKNHYEDMIREHPGWELVGIYADEGISGTSLKHRDAFNRMMQDCRSGKIDLIITKSVSRFARNIVDCIAKQRELADMNPRVGVFFETEHIYSLDGTSEMMMAVLAAAAQEESHTKSEIMNISIEQRFSRGIFLTPELLGYDKDDDGNLVINEDEAMTVKLIYYLFLCGFPTSSIAEVLTDLKRQTKLGNTNWSSGSIVNVLQNERHCGDVLSRKTFTPNYLDHKSKKNRQDRNQYRQLDHHEAIVSRETFQAAQRLLAAYKYRKEGYPLPTLQVIDDGSLRGFVPVNRTWTGFSEDDYRKASESAYNDVYDAGSDMSEKIAVMPRSHFDLSGYEIVRAEFFSTRMNPAVTISEGSIRFNTACLKKFQNVEYVELLLNSVEHCIAVRPCSKDNVNAIRWGTVREGKWVVLPKSCKGFSEPLFRMMGWDNDCRYRMRGQYCGDDEGQVMIFDLSQTEIQSFADSSDKFDVQNDDQNVDMPKEQSGIADVAANDSEQAAPTETSSETEGDDRILPRRTPVILYPEEWTGSFGDKEGTVLFLQRVKYYGDWDVLRPARTVEGIQEFTAEVLEAMMEEAKELMDKMRDAV